MDADSQRVELLAAELFESKNKENRETAVKSLAMISSEQVYKYMIRALNDRADTVKDIAIKYLGEHHEMDGGDVLEKYLVPLSKHKKSGIRFSAVRALIEYNNKKATDRLVKMLTDKDPHLKCMVADALINNRDSRTAHQILNYLEKNYKKKGLWGLGVRRWADDITVTADHNLIDHLFRLDDKGLYDKMEKVVLSVFDRERCYLHFVNNDKYPLHIRLDEGFPTHIMFVVGYGERSQRFIDIIVDKVKNGDDYEKTIGILMLIDFISDTFMPDSSYQVRFDESFDESSQDIFYENKKLFEGIFADSDDGCIVEYKGENFCLPCERLFISVVQKTNVEKLDSDDFFKTCLPSFVRTYISAWLRSGILERLSL